MSKQNERKNIKLSESTKRFLDAMRKGAPWDRFLLGLARKPRDLQSDSPNPMANPAISITPPQLPFDVDTCYKRIFFPQEQATWWCATRPPIMKPLLTLDVCKVCVAHRAGAIGKDMLAKQQEEKPEQEPPVTRTADTMGKHPRDPSQPLVPWNKRKDNRMDRYGMVWCEKDGGIWVMKHKCEGACKNQFCELNPLKRKEPQPPQEQNTSA